MKRKSLLLMLLAIGTLSVNAQTFSDDFEAYTAGSKLGPQSPKWTTWSSADGGTEDVNVVNNKAHSGTKSIYFSSTSATGGPADVILPFEGPHTTGVFTFKAWFFVPTAKSAYFNFQAENTPGTTWTMECYMNADGTFAVGNASSTFISATYPQDQWMEVKFVANLSLNQWEVFIDSTSVGTYVSPTNKVASIDIYPANAQASYWVDDVSYELTPFTLQALNAAVGNVAIANGLVGQSRVPAVDVRNLGANPITSFDLSISHKGTAILKSLSNLNIASLATYKVNITESLVLPANNDTVVITISNINGSPVDSNMSDNTKTIVVNTVAPAPGKVVFAEEATGTWCQWCPRGAVFMDYMAHNYDGYFAGVAVHNNDPMVVAEYDAAISAMVPGYPSAVVNRLGIIDPSDLEADFINSIVTAPAATIKNGASYDANTRTLKVSLTTTLNQDINGDYKMLCVLTQDSVKGTGSGYNQVNAYSGGANGVMGGFELLGNPVPASIMRYDHVARHIAPSFTGYANAFANTTDSGQSVTYTFTYTLPAAWNVNKLNIIGVMLKPDGTSENASITTVASAVNNGYVMGTEIGGNSVGIEKLDGPDAIRIAPNPGTDFSNIMLNLNAEANVQVDIYNLNGARVATKNYGMLNGAMHLPINMSEFSNGLYLVKILVDNYATTIKLMKN